MANLDATEIRLKAGLIKAEQVRKTLARIAAVACGNCRLQLSDLSNHYDLQVEVVGMTELVCKALLKEN